MRQENIMLMKVKNQEFQDILLQKKKEQTQILKRNGNIKFMEIMIIKILHLKKKIILKMLIIIKI